MPYLKRDSSWKMVQPGCWIDPAGNGHVFPQEVIAEMQRQHPEAGFDVASPDDYEMVVQIVTQELREINPQMKVRIAQHEIEQN